MGLNLEKGQKVELTKEDAGLNEIIVGLGWDVQKYSGGHSFDLDSFAACLTGEKCKNKDRFVYFNNLLTDGVESTGDNITGAGDGDDETIHVKLSDIDSDVDKIMVGAVIYDATAREQNFGQVSNAFVRLVDKSTGKELARYDLGEDFSTKTGIILGTIYRHGGEWKFAAIGEPFDGGFAELQSRFGM